MKGDGTGSEVLILGIGNSLLSDDGTGLHVLTALAGAGLPAGIALRDGGTIGLALLPEIEAARALIAVDACELNAPPGTMQVFQAFGMDRMLFGTKRSAHEVALADLLDAARLLGVLPDRRALVGIQPGSTAWGLEPTPAVAATIPVAVSAILGLLQEWSAAYA